MATPTGVALPQTEEVHALLIDVETYLRQLGLWQQESPPPGALVSQQPFCIDTLGLDQWLQFIFLPMMYELLQSGQDLPTECAIAPMAEEYFRGTAVPSLALQRTLAALDRLLTQSG
jgi:uncharacterized protein YqcC (DUF446 family)